MTAPDEIRNAWHEVQQALEQMDEALVEDREEYERLRSRRDLVLTGLDVD